MHCPVPCADPEGGQGSGPLSNTRSNPLKFSEHPSQHSTLCHHRHASETPLKGVSLAGQWWPAFSDIWILSPLKKKKKNVVRVRIQIRSEWNSGKNVSSIKTFGNAIESIQSINTVVYPTLWCKSRCAREAFQHPFMIFFEITRDSYASAIVSLSLSGSLSLSLLLSKFENSLDPEDLRGLAKPNQGQESRTQ